MLNTPPKIEKQIIAGIINIVNLGYFRDKESRDVQDPEIEFSTVDLSVGQGNQSHWDGRQWLQTMSDIPQRCLKNGQGMLGWEGNGEGHSFRQRGS